LKCTLINLFRGPVGCQLAVHASHARQAATDTPQVFNEQPPQHFLLVISVEYFKIS